MKKQFDAALTGTEDKIDGTVNYTSLAGFTDVFEFTSVDGTLHLVIGRDTDKQWIRIEGTEPYLSSWVDELAEQVAGHTV